MPPSIAPKRPLDEKLDNMLIYIHGSHMGSPAAYILEILEQRHWNHVQIMVNLINCRKETTLFLQGLSKRQASAGGAPPTLVLGLV